MTSDKKLNTPGFSSVEKWMIMAMVILGLSAVIVYFNLRVFGVADGIPYIAVVSFVVLVSLLVTRHIKRHPVTVNFIRAAFCFEVLLTIALGINAAYSLSVMREMSVAGEDEKRQTETLKETTQTVESIAKLTSPAAQRAAARALEAQQKQQSGEKPAAPVSRAAVFAAKERILFWIMLGELAISMLATFTLLGLSVFDRDFSGVPDFLEKAAPSPKPQSPALSSPDPVYGAGKPVIRWQGGKQIRPQ